MGPKLFCERISALENKVRLARHITLAVVLVTHWETLQTGKIESHKSGSFTPARSILAETCTIGNATQSQKFLQLPCLPSSRTLWIFKNERYLVFNTSQTNAICVPQQNITCVDFGSVFW